MTIFFCTAIFQVVMFPAIRLAFPMAFNVFAGLVGGTLGGIVLVYVNAESGANHISMDSGGGRLVLWLSSFYSHLRRLLLLLCIFHGSDFFSPESLAHFKTEILTTLHLKNILFWVYYFVDTILFANQPKIWPG